MRQEACEEHIGSSARCIQVQAGEDAAESFALFIERLVLYTGVKISGGDLAGAVDDPWFAKARHLLAHYSLDTPTLMEARSERQAPVLQQRLFL